MDHTALVDTIDLSKRDFSVILVEPTPTFLEWLDSIGVDRSRDYFPEENTVLVVPKIDRFSKVGSFSEFIDKLKPSLLSNELSRFGASIANLRIPNAVETFNRFFTIFVRDSVTFLSDFK